MQNWFITISWPAQGASMNSRKHWSKQRKVKQAIKQEAAIACRHLPQQLKADSVAVAITFYPPDNRRRDADNLLSSIKPALDAISERIGIDDSKFWPMTLDKGEKTDDARVEINLTIEKEIKS